MKLIEFVQLEGHNHKKANGLICSGLVLVNEIVETRPNYFLKKNDNIRIKEIKNYVSRGALKLIKALDSFKVTPDNYVCIDFGSSTGGFTQALLNNGAKKVYAIDVGFNQLDYSLRIDKRVVVMERTNLKDVSLSNFSEIIDLIVCDVSFISLKHVFKKSFNLLVENKKLIVLIKPQFEGKKEYVQPGGYVEIKHHKEIIDNVVLFANDYGFTFLDLVKSPISGLKSKNQEYLAYFIRRKNV